MKASSQTDTPTLTETAKFNAWHRKARQTHREGDREVFTSDVTWQKVFLVVRGVQDLDESVQLMLRTRRSGSGPGSVGNGLGP